MHDLRAKRQTAYQKIYNSLPITYTNILDAGCAVKSIRIEQVNWQAIDDQGSSSSASGPRD